jgi:hypothetical protein
MKFVVKQTVDSIDLPFGAKNTVYVEYLFRVTGFSLYVVEMRDIFIKGGDKMLAVFKKYESDVRDAILSTVTLMKHYWNTLYTEMGFSSEEASDETFKQFSKRIEDYANLYYELYEIEHFMHMSENTNLIVT